MFAIGAAIPLAIAFLSPAAETVWLVPTGSLAWLAVLEAEGTSAGGGGILKPTVRVTFRGAFAMAATAAIGAVVGHAV